MNEEFKRILIDELDLDEAAVRPETSLENAGIDSLTIVELSVCLAQQLGLEITEEELQSAASLGEIDQMIEQRRMDGRISR